jgi:hypothetical protein
VDRIQFHADSLPEAILATVGPYPRAVRDSLGVAPSAAASTIAPGSIKSPYGPQEPQEE